jgi:hypothetical protein
VELDMIYPPEMAFDPSTVSNRSSRSHVSRTQAWHAAAAGGHASCRYEPTV